MSKVFVESESEGDVVEETEMRLRLLEGQCLLGSSCTFPLSRYFNLRLSARLKLPAFPSAKGKVITVCIIPVHNFTHQFIS